MEFLKQTVEDFLFKHEDVSMLDLQIKADEGGYWASCERFVEENATKKIGELSSRQRDWLVKIKTGLEN